MVLSTFSIIRVILLKKNQLLAIDVILDLKRIICHFLFFGNALSRGTSINKNDKFNFEIIKKSLIKNQIYKIQKNFRKFDFSELFFINPFEKKIEFNLNSEKVYLNPGFTKKIIIKDQDIVELESNIMFFRPTIFSHRNNFIDVHHS